MVTIRQIAEHCGVSASTVSKALNGALDVGQETALRIRKVAEELGYMPNSAARALKTRRTYSFGIFYSAAVEEGLTHEFFARVLNGFKTRSEELGYDIIFIGGRVGQLQITPADHAAYRSCDGVLMVSGNDGDTAVAKEISDRGIPTVCIDYAVAGCGGVLSDNVRGMGDLMRYILARGHRRIAFIYGQDSIVTRTRVETFQKICAEHGIDVPPEYLIRGAYHDTRGAQEATDRLLSLRTPPTCILYPDDFSSVGGRNELERRGLTAPNDISIAGYDGISFSWAIHPMLTTVRQDAETMGRAAAGELARMIEEGPRDGRTILVPSELIPGETVAQIDTK